MTVAAIDQQVFAAPLDRSYFAAGEAADGARHAPAQARLAHRHRGNRAPHEMWLDAPTGDLDFREFWHGETVVRNRLVRRTEYTYTAFLP